MLDVVSPTCHVRRRMFDYSMFDVANSPKRRGADVVCDFGRLLVYDVTYDV